MNHFRNFTVISVPQWFILYSLGVLGALAVQLHLHFRRLALVYPLQRHSKWQAAVFSLTTAALVSFQRPSPSQPPFKNVDSAVSPALPASHFGG